MKVTAADKPGRLGSSKAAGVVDEIQRMRVEVAELKLLLRSKNA